MPLQEQVIDIPIVGGIDEGNSPKLTTRLLSARNCRYTKPGEIWKRYGNRLLAGTNKRLASADAETSPGNTPPEASQLIDFNGELLRIGSGQVDSYVPYDGGSTPANATDWAYKGRVPECIVRLSGGQPIDKNGLDGPPDPVVAISGDLRATAYVQGTLGVQSVYVDVANTASGAVLFSAYDVSIDPSFQSYAPKVVFTPTRLIVFFFNQNYGGVRYRCLTLDTMQWDVATTALEPGAERFDISNYVVGGEQVFCAFYTYPEILAYGFNAATNTKTTVTLVSTLGVGDECDAIAVDGNQADGFAWVTHTVYTSGTNTSTTWVGTVNCNSVTSSVRTASLLVSLLAPSPPNIGARFRHIGVKRMSDARAVINLTSKTGATINLADEAIWNVLEDLNPGFYVTYNPHRKVVAAAWVSRAFEYDGRAYAWIQNIHELATTHFLIDLNFDELELPAIGSPRIVAVTMPELWGPTLALSTLLRVDNLARVVVTDDTATMASLSGAASIEQPTVTGVDVLFGADTNSAVAGNTLVLGGGVVSGYDGVAPFEIGFAYQPRINAATTGTAGGLDPAATYGYKAVWAWRDARGNTYRSVVSLAVSVAMGGNTSVNVDGRGLNLTNRRTAVYLELYRTLADGDVYYLVSSVQNVINGTVSFEDSLSDSDILASPRYHPQLTLDAEVANVIPPSAAFVHVYQSRVWLADVDDDSLWYSKEITSLSGVAFSDEFVFAPFDQPRLAALATLDDKLVLFRTNRTYMLSGEGPDATNTTGTFSSIMTIQTGLGCTEPRSVVACVHGVLFRSAQGITLLSRDGQFFDVGRMVEDTVGATAIVNACLVAKNDCVRVILDRPAPGEQGIVLEYDLRSGTPDSPVWTTHSDYGDFPVTTATLLASCTRAGVWTWINSSGRVFQEASDIFYDDVTDASVRVYVPSSGQLSWTKTAGLNGCQRVWYASLLCDYADSHTMEVSFLTDFAESTSQTVSWTNDVIAAALPEHLRIHVADQECTAFSVSWTMTEPTVAPDYTTGKGCVINGVSLEVGVESGVRKQRASRSR